MNVFSLNLFWKIVIYYLLLSWNGWWLSSSSIRWPHFQWWKKPKYTPGPYLLNISYTTPASFFRVISLPQELPHGNSQTLCSGSKSVLTYMPAFFALLLTLIQNYIIDWLRWGRWNNHDLNSPAAKFRMNWMFFINDMVKTWPYCDKKSFILHSWKKFT